MTSLKNGRCVGANENENTTAPTTIVVTNTPAPIIIVASQIGLFPHNLPKTAPIANPAFPPSA